MRKTSETQQKLFIAYEHNKDVQLFTTSAAAWLDYLGGLDERVRQLYQQRGYYDLTMRDLVVPRYVRHHKVPLRYRLRAVMYRGIPVVMRSEFEKATADVAGKDLKWRIVHL